MDMVFRNEGVSLLWYNGTGSAVSHGDVVQIGDRIAIPAADIAAGAYGTVNIEGIFKAAAIETDAFAVGDQLYWDPSEEELTNLPGLSAAIVATEGNTGDGAAGEITLGDAAVAEVFTLTCTAASENAGTFKVVGSVHGRMPDLTVAVAYDCGFFSFTLADGDTDFAADDTLTLTISQANYKAGFAAAVKASDGAVAEVKIG